MENRQPLTYNVYPFHLGKAKPENTNIPSGIFSISPFKSILLLPEAKIRDVYKINYYHIYYADDPMIYYSGDNKFVTFV